MPDIGYLNGQFSPLEAIHISPDDRGFLFGDGIYEVIRAYHGVPVFWADHFARFARSAKEIQLPFSLEHTEFQRLIFHGLQSSGYAEGKVYIQMTRGVAPREHAFPSKVSPTVFMSFREMLSLPKEASVRGVKVITVPDIRWDRCDIKSLNLLPNVLAKQRAEEAKVFEAIFVRNGLVKEGTTSNLFVVKNGEIRTPERDHFVLPGVTHHQVINLAQQQGYMIQFGQIPIETLVDADEIFLTGTTIEILPVVNLDGNRIKDEKPGPVTQSLQEEFSKLVSRLCS